MQPHYHTCVVGGGPAGSVTALRLAQFGYRVCLVERLAFPRAHVGEALGRSIWATIDRVQLRAALMREGRFTVAPETVVRWAEPRAVHMNASEHASGLLVDRASFDSALLRAAATAGVQVFQPARLGKTHRLGSSWCLEILAGNEARHVVADRIVDATGRHGLLRPARRRTGPRTFALCCYLRPDKPARATLVEALEDAWCWGAPVPGGLFSAMVFLDSDQLRGVRREMLENRWRSCLAQGELFRSIAASPSVGPVVVRDATPYFTVDPITASLIRVGDASFSLDPLSSTGVAKAMQTGLIAALALHTMTVKPGRQALCEQFYRDRTSETISAHASWSSSFYAEVERYGDRPFWQARSARREPDRQQTDAAGATLESGELALETRVRLSESARFVERPCIVQDEIQPSPTLLHPRLDRPVAFVGGTNIAELLKLMPKSIDLAGLLALWSTRIPALQAGHTALWLLNRGILERATEVSLTASSGRGSAESIARSDGVGS